MRVTTRYQVLRSEKVQIIPDTGGDNTHTGWIEIGEAEANSPKQAIRAVTKDPGTYLAVPRRSFQPLRRKQDMKPVDSFEPVEDTEE